MADYSVVGKLTIKWDNLRVNISHPVIKALHCMGFPSVTPVQAACIPLILQRKDVTVEAVTGSGKTLAFLIPMLEMVQKRKEDLRSKEIFSIIISPTRELATQTWEVLSKLIDSLPPNARKPSHSLLVGGGAGGEASVLADAKRLQEGTGCNILVVTPGRLEDLMINHGRVSGLPSAVKELEILILDEADRLLESGLERSVCAVLPLLPRLRRTALFSATGIKDGGQLIRLGLRNPVEVTVRDKRSNWTGGIKTENEEDGATEEATRTPSSLDNFYAMCEPDAKLATLITFLKEIESPSKVILFLPTCACVEYFTKVITEFMKGKKIFSIHGKMKQKRFGVFDSFRQADSGLLICTDVMARGVDVPQVHWVIQYEPPTSASAFVHRCGRTARMGNDGSALLLLLPSEKTYIKFLELNQNVKLKEMLMPKKLLLNEVLSTCHRIQREQREIYDMANRAFVSAIQAYSKHECNLVLRVKDLDLGKMATNYGLLHLPKMPELKNKDVSSFTPVPTEPNSIAYSDKGTKKQVRLNKKQTSVLVNFMFENLDFARGRLEGKVVRARRWEQLTDLLNSHGPTKTISQWMKTWKDVKRKVRAREARLDAETLATGNIGETLAPLSVIEEKVLAILGKVSPTPLVDADVRPAGNINVESGTSTHVEEFLQEESTSNIGNSVPLRTSSRLQPVMDRIDQAHAEKKELETEHLKVMKAISSSLQEMVGLLREAVNGQNRTESILGEIMDCQRRIVMASELNAMELGSL